MCRTLQQILDHPFSRVYIFNKILWLVPGRVQALVGAAPCNFQSVPNCQHLILHVFVPANMPHLTDLELLHNIYAVPTLRTGTDLKSSFNHICTCTVVSLGRCGP